MELRIKPLGLLVVIGLLIWGAVAYYLRGTSDAAGSDPINTASGEIVFISSETKKDWLEDQVKRFNDKYKGKMSVKLQFVETRDAFQQIVKGEVKPALWAPSSTNWVQRLGEYWEKGHKGAKPLLDVSDTSAYRVYLRTPMVFMTTTDKASVLRPLLSQGSPWEAIRALSNSKKKLPWGEFKYSYADPINSGSGFMTLSMIINDYGNRTKKGNLEAVAKSQDFFQYMTELNTHYVYDAAALKGSSQLFKSFKEDPSRYDFICTYESNALKAAQENPRFAVIYPNPTATVDMSIVELTGADWLTPAQKSAGRVFLKFLSEKEAMQAGVKTAFRPAQPAPDISLNPDLKKVSAQGFQETFTATEVPPYDAVNDAAFEWRKRVKSVVSASVATLPAR